MVFETDSVLLPGSKLVLHHQQLAIPAHITRLVAILDPTTGAVTRAGPRFVPKNTTATLELKLDTTVCIENFRACREMGRVLLRAAGKTVAAGVVVDP